MTWVPIFYTRCGIVGRRGMASFKAKFPVLQELFAKNHRGAFGPPPSGARVKLAAVRYSDICTLKKRRPLRFRPNLAHK